MSNIIPALIQDSAIDAVRYQAMYAQSVANPHAFWGEQGRTLDWFKPYTKVLEGDFTGEAHIKWFSDGELNLTHNCIDRHLATRSDQTALIWEGDNQADQRRFTYRELHTEVCRFANVLKAHGIQKGDTVTIYLPMIPEAAFAMLACARIGAVHSVVFGGFSPDSLKTRLKDCGSKLVITADQGWRGGKTVPLKANIDAALVDCPFVTTTLVVRRTGNHVAWQPGRDLWYHEEAAKVGTDCPAETMNAEDPLFILYTSGSTGTPKGVLHTTGGYLLYASLTHKHVFDYRAGEVYWCTADIGWVTGHSYVVYGPLCNGATTLMYEGVPNYPDCARLWQIVDRHKVNIFYTAPTAIRALMREGDAFVKSSSRSSLRILASVGEPINPEAWLWFYNVVGDGRCPVIDTWWQTETGGHMIAPLPGATPLKPGSATKPFFGIQPVVVDGEGKILPGACEGNLCIKAPWPGMMRSLYKNHARFIETYLSPFKGMYFTGDGCRRDEDGDYWITGRVDDVINVAGHRFGTAEIESALVAHAHVAEAAVVGMPHDIKGQGIYAYVTLNVGIASDDALRAELVQWVRKQIGPIATPDIIQWAPGLPKTRSGKIMRRILRKIAAGETDSLGDISTLADPAVVASLVENRQG